MNELKTDATIDPSELTDKEVQERIAKHILEEAKTKPWSNSWKYITAKAMLREGRDIAFVSDIIGVSYKWLFSVNLIKWVDVKNKNGLFVRKMMAPV